MPRIVFHGENATCFSHGFADLAPRDAQIILLPDVLETDEQKKAYATADMIVGVKFDASLPTPENLSLFHVPGAGYDSVNLDLLPSSAMVCNCFGHDPAIAEYVLPASSTVMCRLMMLMRNCVRETGPIGRARQTVFTTKCAARRLVYWALAT